MKLESPPDPLICSEVLLFNINVKKCLFHHSKYVSRYFLLLINLTDFDWKCRSSGNWSWRELMP